MLSILRAVIIALGVVTLLFIFGQFILITDDESAPELVFETIKQEEGFSATVYEDTRGIKTIGYGFRLSEGFTQRESELVLNERLHVRFAKLQKALPWMAGKSIETQGALLDMSWQNGLAGLLGYQRNAEGPGSGRLPRSKASGTRFSLG